MAYHFRKLRNTLRLLPSTKTMGFGLSTRLNEGDNHFTLPACPDVNAALASHNDIISRSLKHAVHNGLENSSCCSVSGITRSQSDLDVTTSQFLPTVISKPGSVLPVPVTYNDLAQILRLPMPVSADKDSCGDVVSAVRVVYPSSDDILVDVSQGLSDFVPSNQNFKDFFRRSFSCSSVDDASKSASMDSPRHSCAMRLPQSRHLSMEIPSNLLDSSAMASPPIQKFSSNCDHDQHLPSCSLFSSSMPKKAESPSTSSSCGPPQGKSSGKDVPSSEQMHKMKEKLEKAVCKLFSGRQDNSILHKNIVFENNLFGDNKTSVGLLAYTIEIMKLRLRTHARFSNISVELQSVTMLEQNGVIRIHWRLRGVSQIQTLKFWRLFQSKNSVSRDEYEWLEAFSYFHIGKDGLVHKHRIDRMIPDDMSGTEKITNTLRELLTPAKPLVS